MANQTAADRISLPRGGGALAGIGETFQPDLHTGTGNFQVPLPLPAGRNGFQPSLTLAYSTANPNGHFGLGWALTLPQIRRKTSQGVPRYSDATDVFVLTGAEDLVPVSDADGSRSYRPRTETSFARISHVSGLQTGDYWEAWSKDGLRSRYGTRRPSDAGATWSDPAAIVGPDGIFAWLISETVDPFGNRIDYTYELDSTGATRHLTEIRYADYGDPASLQYLVSFRVDYETRPDPFSDRRPGFELRTTRRATGFSIRMQAPEVILAKTIELTYADQAGAQATNGVSLLTKITISGHDGQSHEQLPPLEFGYTDWQPLTRRLTELTGELPASSLGVPGLDLVDLFGDGRPCICELSGFARYWRNRGHGAFDPPRAFGAVPAGATLGSPGVELADMDGDGRPDLFVSTETGTGYWPLQSPADNGADGHAAGFDLAGYVAARAAPTLSVADPAVRLIDLDGDGKVDVLRAGAQLVAAYNDGHGSFQQLQTLRAPDGLARLDYADPRVRLADMTGDGLTDIVMLHSGAVSYWPNLGYGRFGPRIVMANPPKFEDGAGYDVTGFDPRRLFLGDIAGDGAADLVYVGDGHVTVWVNQSGNRFADAEVIGGTPRVSDASAIRLADLEGTGVCGILWSADAVRPRARYAFLDLTGGTKPYLLNRIDNHRGAITTVEYSTSTLYAEADRSAGTPWRTTLPFPVHVVSKVTVSEAFTGDTLTTEYGYHHGYWDGAEREFRGFARVDHRDAETAVGAPPPTETRTWFHLGPVGPEYGGWSELVLSHEYWREDGSWFARPGSVETLLAGLPRRAARDAVRALRGRIQRTEVYALDGDERQERPYTVSEQLHGVTALPTDQIVTPEPSEWQPRVFFPHLLAERTTQWERGSEPLSRVVYVDGYDSYGRPRSRTEFALARGARRGQPSEPPQPHLVTQSLTNYATRDDADRYIIDRVALATAYEIPNDGADTIDTLYEAITSGAVERRLIAQTVNAYDGAASVGLPVGELGDYGALVSSERLAFTVDLLHEAYASGESVADPPEEPAYLTRDGPHPWTSEYPDEFRSLLPTLAGYHYRDEATTAMGYFVPATRHCYDFQTPGARARGLVLSSLDPLGGQIAVVYDDYELLPVSFADAAGLEQKVSYDYRTLHPAQVIDVNGNQTRFAYTPLGLLASTSLLGKPNEPVGDSAGQPNVSFMYDFAAFERGRPVFAHTIRRRQHRWQLIDGANEQRSQNGEPPLTAAEIEALFPPDEPTRFPERFIQSREYSDAFGLLLQTRAETDDVLFGDEPFGDCGLDRDQSAPPSDAVGRKSDPAMPCVVVSGWQIYDEKGRVVTKYEPFFSTGWDYARADDALLAASAKVTMEYDALGRLTRTVRPDGSEERIVRGVPGTIATPDLNDPDRFEPTPWETFTYDANDDAGRTHPDTSSTYSSHWNTPANTTIDALGRTVRAIARNGPDPASDWYRTSFTYDIRGNLLQLVDALGRTVGSYVYDLLDRPWRSLSLDGGLSRSVHDASGNVVEHRDTRDAVALHAFDMLRRPIRIWANNEARDPPDLRVRTVFGDAPESGLSPAAAAARNALGRPLRTYDEAGLISVAAYDFKGNITEETRQVIADDAIVADWAARSADGWQHAAFRVNWTPPTGMTLEQLGQHLLDPTLYETSTAYDARDHPVAVIHPTLTTGVRPRVELEYSRSGAITSVHLDGTTYVERIVYDAHGRQTMIVYGNSVMSRYAYDHKTARLVRLRSEAFTQPSPLTYHPTGPPTQDFAYDYDLAGNLLMLHDRTPGSGLATPPQPHQLDRMFSYTPLYRLATATGRECDTQPTEPGASGPRSADVTQARLYTETYEYDLAGNLLSLAHRAGGGGFTRTFTLAPASNRLASMGVDSSTYAYAYDENGNIVAEAVRRQFEWDFGDRLQTFRIQAGPSEPSVYTQYLYDASGKRAKKLVRKGAGILESTVYVAGVERFTLARAGTLEVSDTLTFADEIVPLAEVRYGTPAPGDTTPPVKYHLADHLGSSNVVLDAAGSLVTREEYTPYGDTSLGSYGKKRYRFTGKRRDEESGLSHHGARYYAPWLGRWLSCDPSGHADSLNRYAYVHSNPLRLIDSTGLESVPAVSSVPAQLDAPHAAAHDPPQTVRIEEGFLASIVSGKQKPGFGKSLIPILGSVQSANYHFNHGEWVWGSIYTALAISDVFLLRSIFTGAFRLASRGAVSLVDLGQTVLKELKLSIGTGSKTPWTTKLSRFFIQDLATYNPASSPVWRILREHFQVSTSAGKRAMFEMHHWLIQHGWYEGKNAITNSYVRRALQKMGDAGWNLIPMPSTINNLIGKSVPATVSMAHEIGSAIQSEAQWLTEQFSPLFPDFHRSAVLEPTHGR